MSVRQLHYKFLFLDHRNYLRSVSERVFAEDRFACENAQTILTPDDQAIEVWQDARFVCRIDNAGRLHFTPPHVTA